MREYDISTYGDTFAEAYDDLYQDRENLGSVVALLAELAAGGKSLELGIGTGRVALPLAERGVEVHGIDVSEAMVAKLRAKPGGDAIPVTMGDFADLGVAESYALVFVVFNTFFGLLTQDDQVRCFRNVAEHLDRDGVFLIEAFRPRALRPRPAYRRHQRGGGQGRPQHGTPRPSGPARNVSARGTFREGDAALPCAGPLLVAFRARPDGPAGGPTSEPSVERLAPLGLHGHKRQPYLSVREGIAGPSTGDRMLVALGWCTILWVFDKA